MRKIISLWVCLTLCFTFTCGTVLESDVFAQRYELVDKERCIVRSLVWSDEFNGNELNTEEWSIDLGQVDTSYSDVYQPTAREENVKVANGFLDISSQISFNNNERRVVKSDYIGSIHTRDSGFRKFNEVEIRAKISPAYGVSSTSYLLGKGKLWPKCGELDLFQYNNDEDLLTQVLITPKTYNVSGFLNQKVWRNGLDKSKFHIFKVKWWDKKVEFYIDNTLTGTYDPANYSTDPEPTKDPKAWPFTESATIRILNSMNPEIAGRIISEGWTLVKENEDSKDYETHTYVDYVRCYYNGKASAPEYFEKSEPRVDEAHKKKKSKKLTFTHLSFHRHDGVQVRVYKSKKQAKKNKKYIVNKVKKTKGTTTVVKSKKLKNKKKLYVRVRHYLVLYGKKYYSMWSAPKKVKIKKK